MKAYSALIISSFFLLGLASCDTNCPGSNSPSCITNNGAPTEATVTVKDASGNPMTNVTVKAYHIQANSILNDPAESQAWTKYTTTGVANLDFSTLYRRGQSNVATVFLEVSQNGVVLNFANQNDQKLDLKMEQNVEHTVTVL